MKENIKVEVSGVQLDKKSLKSLNPEDIGFGFLKVKISGIMKQKKLDKILKIIKEE